MKIFAERAVKATRINKLTEPEPMKIRDYQIRLHDAFHCDRLPTDLEFTEDHAKCHETIKGEIPESFNQDFTKLYDELRDILLPKVGISASISCTYTVYKKWKDGKTSKQRANDVEQSAARMTHIQSANLCRKLASKIHDIPATHLKYCEKRRANIEATSIAKQQELTRIEDEMISVLAEIKEMIVTFLKNRDRFAEYTMEFIPQLEGYVYGFEEKNNVIDNNFVVKLELKINFV